MGKLKNAVCANCGTRIGRHNKNRQPVPLGEGKPMLVIHQQCPEKPVKRLR